MQRHLQLFGLDADDPSRSLTTCVKELFENAVDAACGSAARAPASARRIEVAVSAAGGELWHVKVTDDGRGFDASQLCL